MKTITQQQSRLLALLVAGTLGLLLLMHATSANQSYSVTTSLEIGQLKLI